MEDDRNEDLGRRIEEASSASELVGDAADATRFDRAVNGLVEAVGVAIFATIVGIVFVNALGRYAFAFTFIWGDEIVLSLLPWLGMTGMFLAIRRRAVIRIEYFANLFPKTVSRMLHITASVFASAMFIWLAVVSTRYVGFFGSDKLIYLDIEKFWFMYAMVIGPAIAAFAYLIMAWQDFRAGRLHAR